MTLPWNETLTGVVIGGVIGLATHALVAWVNTRAEHRQWLRQERLTAYRVLVTEWGRKYKTIGDVVNTTTNPEHYPLDHDYLESLYDVIWDVCLVASPRTTDAAWRAYKALLAVHIDGPSLKGFREWQWAGDAFDGLRIALRRDLGSGRGVEPPDFND